MIMKHLLWSFLVSIALVSCTESPSSKLEGQAKETFKNIQLVNLVWDYNCDEYKEEEKEGLRFVEDINKKLTAHFNDLDVKFSVEYVRYSDFLTRVDWTNDLEHRAYLKRYEV